MLNRTIAPPIAFPKAIPNLLVQPEILGELPFYTLEGGSEDVLKIDVIFKAGTRHETLPLLANTALGMLKEGSANFSAKQIAETVDFYGAQLQTDISHDRSEVSLVTQGKHLGALLEVFADVLIAPTFPEKEFQQYVRRSKNQLSVNLEKVQFGCRLLLSELMFPNHPYREEVSVAAYDLLSANDLKAYHATHYNLANAYVTISGKNTLEAKRMLSEALIAQRSKGGENVAIIVGDMPPNWQYTPSEQRLKRKAAVQSAIRMGTPALFRNHPDYPILYLANIALGGYFGSRLMQNIREDKGYTYGIGSSINILEHAAYLLISTQVGAEVTDVTIKEVEVELERMQTQIIPDAELNRIKRYVLGNLVESFDGPFATADRLKLLINHDLRSDYFTQFAERIPTITGEEVLKISQEFFRRELFSVAVVGEW